MKKIYVTSVLLLLVLSLTACGTTEPIDDDTIVIGATPVPHSEILEFIRPALEDEGYTLEIIEFTDYVLPNEALANQELDANFFQHDPYLQSFNEAHDTTLVSAFPIHFEPLGIYSSSYDSLDDVGEGASFAIPNDASNLSRALKLLESEGLITLAEKESGSFTLLDIEENPMQLSFTEVEAASVPSRIDDVDFAVINGNYALNAEILETLIVSEDPASDAATTYGNVIAVREGDEDSAAIETLKTILQSESVKSFIRETYGSSVLPVF